MSIASRIRNSEDRELLAAVIFISCCAVVVSTLSVFYILSFDKVRVYVYGADSKESLPGIMLVPRVTLTPTPTKPPTPSLTTSAVGSAAQSAAPSGHKAKTSKPKAGAITKAKPNKSKKHKKHKKHRHKKSFKSNKHKKR